MSVPASSVAPTFVSVAPALIADLVHAPAALELDQKAC